MQDCSNSIAYALELLQYCTKPSICCLNWHEEGLKNRRCNIFNILVSETTSHYLGIPCIEIEDGPSYGHQLNNRGAFRNTWLVLTNRDDLGSFIASELLHFQDYLVMVHSVLPYNWAGRCGYRFPSSKRTRLHRIATQAANFILIFSSAIIQQF